MDLEVQGSRPLRMPLRFLPTTSKERLTWSPGTPAGWEKHCESTLCSLDAIVYCVSPGEVYCFDSVEEDTHFWDFTPPSYINETISGKFNAQDLKELYSKADLTEQKFKDFKTRCRNSASGPYLKYLGTSSTVRDLVSLGDAILGQGQPIDYVGVSYGTVIGFNLINSKPLSPDTLVIPSDRNLVVVFPEVRPIPIKRQSVY